MKIDVEIEIPMEESIELSELLLETKNRHLNIGLKRTSPNTILFRDVETDELIECENYDYLTNFKSMLEENRIPFEETPI